MATANNHSVLLTIPEPLQDITPNAADTTSGKIWLYRHNKPIPSGATIVAPLTGGGVMSGPGGLVHEWQDELVNLDYTVSGLNVAGYVTPKLWCNAGAATLPLDHLMISDNMNGGDGTEYRWSIQYTSSVTGRVWNSSGRGQLSSLVDYETEGTTVTISAVEVVLSDALNVDTLGGSTMTNLINSLVVTNDAAQDAAIATNAADIVTLETNNTGTNTGDEVAATESVAGVVERTTQAEADAGTDTTRYMSTANLHAVPFGGDVSGTIGATVVANDSHTHDSHVIAGDVSGTLSATVVADNSHNHLVANISNFSTGSIAGDVTGTLGATVVGNDSHTHNAHTLAGDVTGTLAATVVGDDSHSHTDATLTLPAANRATAGILEVATEAEVNTGTSDTKALTPLNLAGSTIGTRALGAHLTATNLVGDVTGTVGATVVGADSHTHTTSTITDLSSYAVGGDVSGTLGAVVITNDSHSHTVSTISDLASDVTILGGDLSGSLGAAVVGNDSHTHNSHALAGDVTGTLSATVVANDSHTHNSHVLSGDVTGTLSATVVGNDSHLHNAHALAGDVTGTLNATVVGDDSHNHTSATVAAASTTVAGVVELATVAETTAGASAVLAVTPAGIAGFTFAGDVTGTIGATVVGNDSHTHNAHVLVGDVTGTLAATVVGNDSHSHTISTITDIDDAVLTGDVTGTLSANVVGNDSHSHTDATLPAASLTVAGVAEIATAGEITTGTDNDKIVSPLGLASAALGGDLSGTISTASVANDSHTHNAHVLAGDVTGTLAATVVGNDSHTHDAHTVGGDVTGTLAAIVVTDDSHNHNSHVLAGDVTGTLSTTVVGNDSHTHNAHALSGDVTGTLAATVVGNDSHTHNAHVLAGDVTGTLSASVVTMGGDISGTSGAAVVANDSHTHNSHVVAGEVGGTISATTLDAIISHATNTGVVDNTNRRVVIGSFESQAVGIQSTVLASASGIATSGTRQVVMASYLATVNGGTGESVISSYDSNITGAGSYTSIIASSGGDITSSADRNGMFAAYLSDITTSATLATNMSSQGALISGTSGGAANIATFNSTISAGFQTANIASSGVTNTHSRSVMLGVSNQSSVDNNMVHVDGLHVFDSIVNMNGLPTSAAGLASGDLWNNSGVMNIA